MIKSIMNIVGLTGGIATGKSTVSHFLESLEIPIIDADLINKQLLLPKNIGYKAVLKLFPDIPLLSDDSLDKRHIRDKVFNHKPSKELIEQKLHPLIKEEISAQIKHLKTNSETPYCIVSVPLLIEANFSHLVNEIWICDCAERTQTQRLMARDKISQTDAKLIMSHQLSRSKRLKYADEIINTEEMNAMQKKILALHLKKIKLNSV